MTWTKTPPTVPGWYWWRRDGTTEIPVCLEHEKIGVVTKYIWNVWGWQCEVMPDGGLWGPRIPSADELTESEDKCTD